MPDDQDSGGAEKPAAEDQMPAGAKAEKAPVYIEAGEAARPAATRGQSDERPPTEEDLDARERGVRPQRRPMGPPLGPASRGARAEESDEPADVPEVVIEDGQDR